VDHGRRADDRTPVSYLKTLMQQAGKSEDEFDPKMTKADASKLIDELQNKTGRGQ